MIIPNDYIDNFHFFFFRFVESDEDEKIKCVIFKNLVFHFSNHIS